VEAFTSKTDPQTLNDIYSQLLTTESRVEAQKEEQQISVHVAFCGGRGDGGGRGGRGAGRGNCNKTPCQVCGKTDHDTLRCYKRFDANYNGEDKYANATTTEYNVDTEWYTDIGATDHITFELDKLTTREKYGGADLVHTTSGSSMPIHHIGQSSIRSRDHNLILRNVLHVPSASKNLVSVHKFTRDNNAFFEIYPWYFFS
jgi:hypothetical protein